MRGWWKAVVQKDFVVNPVEDARRDMALLSAIGRRAAD
jgi:hypothetical protein